LPVCETVFTRYDLSDRLVEEPAYNHLIAELIELIRRYVDDNRPNFT